jgi:hypothetical protein
MTKQQRKQPARVRAEKPAFLARLTSFQRDLLCIALLYVITLGLFRGIVFDNAAFATEGDTASALSYSHAGDRIAGAEGVDVLWMPFFFSGMPTFGNVAYIPHHVSYMQNIAGFVLNLLYLRGTWTWLIVFYFLGGIFMFMLMRVLKFSHAAALLGAIIFMLSPYNIGLAAEGHGSKLMALTYVPLVFMLTHLLFERRTILSFGLLTAAIGTLALTNHMQIVYYAFMVIGLYLLYQIVMEVRKAPGRMALVTALFSGALVLGLCIASYIYLSVYEYSQFSIRGGGTAGSTGGLSWDYATNWSWHPQEILTLFIPSFFGFQSPYYWGTMPFTNSTVYIGIAPILLAVLALVYTRTRLVVFIFFLTGGFFLISFGKHFPLVYETLFNYLPFFNKFRVPVMVLHLLPFLVGILAGYGLDFLLEVPDRGKQFDPSPLARTLFSMAGVLVGLLVIGFLVKDSLAQGLGSSMLTKEGELELYRQEYGAQTAQIMAQLKTTRFDMLWKDFVKFVFIAAVSLGLVGLFLKGKLSKTLLVACIFVVLLFDLLLVINKGGFISPKPPQQLEARFAPDATVLFLQQQPGLFRVFPLGNLFMDNSFAYHGIQSIGGYSPAKLKIYQTMLDSCLYQSNDQTFPINMNIVNMLNTGYLIAQGQLPADRFTLVNADQAKRMMVYKNNTVLPRAFFVREVRVAAGPSEVFALMNSPAFNAGQTAILEKNPPTAVTAPDSAVAAIAGYTSRRITLNAFASSTALLVLSEVYYPAGWKAFVDGQETEILKTNYVLRSIVVPAGSHEIVLSFDPPLYSAGYTLSNVAWVIALVCVLIGLWQIPGIRARLKLR